MKIKNYIQQEVIEPRIAKQVVFVVYDDRQQYRDLCLGMADDKTAVIDASAGSIESRELAIKTLQQIGGNSSQASHSRMLVYVATAPPSGQQEQMNDPFWTYAVTGDFFPRKTGDDFEQICLAAKSDHVTEIRKLFADYPSPSFELVDSIGSGTSWPKLKEVLQVESTREIILAMLAPKPKQLDRLNSNSGWLNEAKELLKRNLGVELKTKQTKQEPIADELWRLILFSEFVFDLPDQVQLPGSLKSVPRAENQAQPLVYDICDGLRSNTVNQQAYIERAQEVEEALELRSRCKEIADLGDRDTFPFEERSFFLQCVMTIKADGLDLAKDLLQRSRGSVWAGRGESQEQWNLVASIIRLVESCGDCAEQFGDFTSSQESLIFFYTRDFFKVDQYHREMEFLVGEVLDLDGVLAPAIEFARKKYRLIADQIQTVFVKHLESTGWPPAGLLPSTEIFDRHVAPVLKESGRKVAYFMIDALRYELGVELEKELADDSNVQLEAAFSVIPTVTPIGMTSLLPEASVHLNLKQGSKGPDVAMGDQLIKNVGHRMKWIESRYGDRFCQKKLEDVVPKKFVKSFTSNSEHVELLVVRSSSVDARMETEYQSGLPAIKKDLRAIRAAIHRLRECGFEQVVIATDHGFCINPTPDAGDSCKPPSGDWKKLHDRCILGVGAEDTNNWVCSTEHLGLKGEYEQIGGPRSFACYTQNNQYFHGGASLQEAVVPCLIVGLRKPEEDAGNVAYSILYKRGAAKITTLIPVFEIVATAGDLFETSEGADVILQAVDSKGAVIGEPRAGGDVNPATGTIRLELGGENALKIAMKMDSGFEGPFTVELVDPATLAQLAQLKLETDYLV